MNILLCDDDLHFLKQLEAAVRKECARIFPEKLYYTVVPGCSSAEEVLTFAEKQPVDLLFLDIDMPSMTGFELAKRLNESQPDAVIIFVSGYDHFVYDAFAYSPFAYLRKKRLGKELPLILERYFEKMQAMKKRFCFGYEGLDFSVSEILYFESVKNYYDIYCPTAVCTVAVGRFHSWRSI